METNKKKNFLTSFKKSSDSMILTSESAWNDGWSGLSVGRRSVLRSREYTPEEIEKIITSGSLESQIELSRYYFYKDGFYKRILIYYATLLKYSGVLIPNPAPGKNLSNSKIQKSYYNALECIEKSNLPELFTECSLRALRDGCYYGIILNNNNCFSLIDLPIKYCRTRFKDDSGNDIIEFDVNYFKTITDSDIREKVLSSFPSFISKYYKKWEKGKINVSWIMIPASSGICIPLLDGHPTFLNIIPATLQYEEAIETQQEKELEEIRKIIVQKIPHLNDGTLLFEPDEAEEIHRGTVGMMKPNKNVSVLTTYADVDSVVSRTSAESNSNVLDKMVQNIYNQGGVSGQIFSATGNMSVDLSIKNDAAFMMVLGNKYSRIITNLINLSFGNASINFKYNILPITYYNEQDYISDSFKLAQSGYSYLLPTLALGVSQRDIVNLKYLERDILELEDILVPLGSAYTQSASNSESDSEGGRPEKKDEEKSDKTIKNKESVDSQGGSNNEK